MAKVFISYSRKDTEFAKKLTGELQKSDMDFWIDWEGIPPTVDWWREIEKGIEEADVFVFLISPDSATSKICGQEIDVAVKNGKRIIPIVVREIEWEDTPPQLGHLNYIFFSRDDDFDTAVKKLLTAIQTDYEWVQEHRRLQMKALEWERNQKENSFLLRGKDLQEAESQLATNTSKEPHPTDLQREHIFASRKAADRQRRITTGISIAGIIALAALAVYGFIQAGLATANAKEAENQAAAAQTAQANAESAQATAEAESRRAISGQLALESKSVLEQYPQRAQLLGLEALKVNIEAGEVTSPIAEEALRAANSRVTGIGLPGFSKEISFLQFTSDDQWLIAGSEYSGEFRVWDINKLDDVEYVPIEDNLNTDESDSVEFYVSEQEKWLVASITKLDYTDLGESLDSESTETYLYSLSNSAYGSEPAAFDGPIIIFDDQRALLESQRDSALLWTFNDGNIGERNSVVLEGEFVALSADNKIYVTKIIDGNSTNLTFWELNWNKNLPPQTINQLEFSNTDNNTWFIEGTPQKVIAGKSSEFTTTLSVFETSAPLQSPQDVVLPASNLLNTVEVSPNGSWLKVNISATEYFVETDECVCWEWETFFINLDAETPVVRGPLLFLYDNETYESFLPDILMDDWYVYLDYRPDKYPGDEYGNTYAGHYFVDLRNNDLDPDHTFFEDFDWTDLSVNTDEGGTWLRYRENHEISMDILDSEGRLEVRTNLAEEYSNTSSEGILRSGFEDSTVISTTSLDENWYAEGSYGGSLRLWNMQEERKYLLAPYLDDRDSNRYLSLSSDGRWLATKSELWRLEDGLPSGQSIQFTNTIVNDATFSPDSKWFLYFADFGDTAWLVNLDELAKDPSSGFFDLRELYIDDSSLEYMEFSPDSQWLIMYGEDSVMLDLTDSQEPKLFALPEGGLSDIIVPSNGNYIIGTLISSGPTAKRPDAAPYGSTIFIWEPTTSGIKFITEYASEHFFRPSPDGRWLWDEDSRQFFDMDCVIENYPCEPIPLNINTPESDDTYFYDKFSPSGNYLLETILETSSSSRSYRIWDLDHTTSQGQAEPELIYDNAPVRYEWSSAYWDIIQPLTRRIHPYSGGGGGGGDGVGSFKVDYGIEVIASSSATNSLQPVVLRGHEENVEHQLISPSGRYALTISKDSVKLWDLDALQADPFSPPVNLPINFEEISYFAFTLDERWLVFVINENRLEFHPLRVDDMMAQACRSVGRNFIINEWQRYFLSADYRQTCENLPEHPSVFLEE